MLFQTLNDTLGGIIQGFGIVFLVQGVLLTFFGYRFHRWFVYMVGFVIGASIGLILIPPDSMPMFAIVGVFSGAIGGYLALVLEVVLVAGIGVILGDIIGMAMFQSAPLDAGPLLLAMIMGFLIWKGYALVIILYTATVGGILSSQGFYLFQHGQDLGYALMVNPLQIIDLLFSFGILAGIVALLGVVAQLIFVFGMGATVGGSKPTVKCPKCGDEVNPLDDVCPHCRAQVGEEVREQYLYSSRLSDTANLLAYKTHTPHYKSSEKSERPKTREESNMGAEDGPDKDSSS